MGICHASMSNLLLGGAFPAAIPVPESGTTFRCSATVANFVAAAMLGMATGFRAVSAIGLWEFKNFKDLKNIYEAIKNLLKGHFG